MAQISQIIPTYNMIKTVARTVDSCLGQDAPVFVIDDGSTDGTYEHLKERYGDKIHLYNMEENKGMAAAMNYVLQFVDTPFFTVIGADDWVDKDNIKNWIKQDLVDVNYCNGGGVKPVPPTDIRANIIKNIGSDRIKHCHQFYTDTGRHLIDGTGCLCLKSDIIRKEKYDTNLRNKEGGELLIRLALLGYEFRYFDFVGGYRDRIGKSSNQKANDVAITYIKKKLNDFTIPR